MSGLLRKGGGCSEEEAPTLDKVRDSFSFPGTNPHATKSKVQFV